MWKNIYKTTAFLTLSCEENNYKTKAFLTLFQNTNKTKARITFLRPRFVREKKTAIKPMLFWYFCFKVAKTLCFPMLFEPRHENTVKPKEKQQKATKSNKKATKS